MDLTNKSQLIDYLKQHNLWAKKGLSQNFLIDKNALDKIVKAAELESDDLVIEIGPGLGTLTERLAEKAGEVVAVEMDEVLAERLVKQFKIYTILDPRLRGDDSIAVNLKGRNNTTCHSESTESSRVESRDLHLISESQGDGIPKRMQIPKQVRDDAQASVLDDKDGVRDDSVGKLEIICDDIMNVNLDEILGYRKYKVVANIPYHITSKILELFLSREQKPELIVLLVQKEVAERVCAKPGQMSVLALSVQLYGKPEIIGIVPKESFFPSPKVDSAILKVDRIQISDNSFNEKEFFRLVHIGFAAKRKTLVNNLIVGYKLEREQVVDILKEIGLKETVRAQELSIGEWKQLAEKINC